MPRFRARLSTTRAFLANLRSLRAVTPHFVPEESQSISGEKSFAFVKVYYLATVASLPFRFKGSGGANMAPITQTVQHHHRSTTKTTHKPFKSGHATKRQLKDQSKGSSFFDTSCICFN